MTGLDFWPCIQQKLADLNNKGVGSKNGERRGKLAPRWETERQRLSFCRRHRCQGKGDDKSDDDDLAVIFQIDKKI